MQSESLSGQFVQKQALPNAANLPEVVIDYRFAQPADANDRLKLLATLYLPDGYHQNYTPQYFKISIAENMPARIVALNYPEKEAKESFGVPAFYDQVTITAELEVETAANDQPRQFFVEFYYQLCDENGICLRPTSQSRQLTLPQTGTADSAFDSSFWGYLLLAFLGGIIINFMPCVLPTLSLRALSIINGSHSRSTLIRQSLLNVAGIECSFLLLAVVLAALKSGGELAGWGFQFQNPRFTFFLLTVLFLFALSLFDFFPTEIPMPLRRQKKLTGYIASFLSGFFTVFLATPCTAPLLGSALAFSFTLPTLFIIIFFLCIGLGLAMPFILLALMPRQLSRLLPKPGVWMTRFRQVMGFLLFLVVIWLYTVLASQLADGYELYLLPLLLLLAFVAWLYAIFFQKTSNYRQQLFRLLLFALVTTVVIGWTPLPVAERTSLSAASDSAEFDDTKSDWLPFEPKEIAAQVQRGDKPIFVAFSAAWCLTCQINEASTLNNDTVIDFFKKHNTLLYYGDFTNYDRRIAEWLQRYNHAGVPLYLFYAAGTSTPRILPELLTPSQIYQLFE